MKSFLKFSLWSLFVLLLASLVTAGLLTGLAHEGLANSGSWTVVVDGDTVAHAGSLHEAFHDEELGLFGGFLAIALTVFLLGLMLPLLLLLGVGLPLLCVMLALGAVAVSLLGVAALLAAPLLLPVLLVVWVARRRPTVAA